MNDTLLQGVILPLLNTLILAVLPVLGTMALQALRKRNINTEWFEVIGRGGGVAYASLVASGRPVTDKTAMAKALAEGAAYIVARKPDIVADKGLGQAAVEEIAGAELGRLLAVDPTVSVPRAFGVARQGVAQ